MNVSVGAIDPMEVFMTSLQDIMEIGQTFEKHESLPGIEMLRAVTQVKDTVEALMHVIAGSVIMPAFAAGRVTEDDMNQMAAEEKAEQTRIEGDPEGVANDIMRLLARFGKAVPMPEDLG